MELRLKIIPDIQFFKIKTENCLFMKLQNLLNRKNATSLIES